MRFHSAIHLLAATVLPSYAVNKAVTWSSSNESVATVSATGLVTTLSPGTATITVMTVDGDYTDTCTVTVTDPVLVARLNSGCIVDETRDFIYGITLCSSGLTENYINENFLSVNGSGYVRYTYSGGTIGTGTTIELVRSSDNVTLATYHLVIFGDLNGDGAITQTDVTRLKSHIAGIVTYTYGTPYFTSVDLNHDGYIATVDLTLLKAIVAGTRIINQTTGIVTCP